MYTFLNTHEKSRKIFSKFKLKVKMEKETNKIILNNKNLFVVESCYYKIFPTE